MKRTDFIRTIARVAFGRATSPHATVAAAGLALAVLAGCGEQTTTERLGLEDPTTVDDFDLGRYEGVWYEIGRYPNSFQEGCEETTATYEERDDGTVDVLNRCIIDGQETLANGTARAVDIDRGKLEVSFFGPFYGDYWILELGEEDGPDEDYTYSVVGSPSRDYLWVLSREPTMDDDTLDGIFERLDEQSFDEERFEYTDQ